MVYGSFLEYREAARGPDRKLRERIARLNGFRLAKHPRMKGRDHIPEIRVSYWRQRNTSCQRAPDARKVDHQGAKTYEDS